MLQRVSRNAARLFGVLVVAAALLPLVGDVSFARQPRTHLVIVVDGLRPDYVTRDVMPRLSALGQRGIVFTAHHSVFPTVTRVNAASFVTGTYPETHGLLGNTIYIPSFDETDGVDTSRREKLVGVQQSDGRLLDVPTLPEILAASGKTMLAVSSGSSGSAFLLDPRGKGWTIHTEFTRPADLGTRVLGPVPPHATPNDAQNRYAIDAYLTIGLNALRPDVTFMWINDPDGTAHTYGIAAPMTRTALAQVDAGIGRIEDTLRAKGLLDHTNIVVTSDHGFSTHGGSLKLEDLVAPFAKTLADGSKDIVVAESAIYLRSPNHDAPVAELVAMLQKRPEIGAIFTRPPPGGGPQGVVAGTLSYDLARWKHARAGDILVSANWSQPGETTDEGVAGHGSSSPYDIHNTLIAAGPDFRAGATSGVPTGNVDVAPTLLFLSGVSIPAQMTGRVIREGLRDAPAVPPVSHERQTVSSPDGSYELTAEISVVEGKRYLDYTTVSRK